MNIVCALSYFIAIWYRVHPGSLAATRKDDIWQAKKLLKKIYKPRYPRAAGNSTN